MARKKTEHIMVVSAHNDDMIIGCGGTIAKYSRQGKKVHNYVFSHGEASHPWLKPKVVVDMRSKELIESNRILGGASIRVFGLTEGKFPDEVATKRVPIILEEDILKIKPTKIFTHAPDDPHPDHRATLRVVNDVVRGLKVKPDIYTFGVWNPIRIRKRNSPRLVIDTSDTFSLKMDALNAHKSQLFTKVSLLWSIISKDLINGIKNHHWFSEVFFKYEVIDSD